MSRNTVLAASVGLLSGLVVAVGTAAVEILLRGLSPLWGLLLLHTESPAIWVVDSLPILLGLAAGVIASQQGAARAAPWAVPAPPIPVETLTKPPDPPPLPGVLRTRTISDDTLRGTVIPDAVHPEPMSSGAAAMPPVPSGFKSILPGQTPPSAPDSRFKALQELVRVLKEQTERTASESRAKSAYLANMSHELRTPLASIVGYAELLQEEAQQQGLEMSADLKKVADSGRSLGQMLNNILDLSKIEVGQLAVVLEDVDMEQIIAELRPAVAELSKGGAVVFSGQVRPGARLIRGDHNRMRQVILNLLSNAFKFTEKGQVQLTIERATPKRDAWIAVRVRDTGVGMTREEAERAMDEYAQVASHVAGDKSSAGLGLAIARKLAELMGGRIEVQSEKNVGSTFSVILPPARISETTIGPRSSIALNERLSGVKLMLVDADPFGISVERFLRRHGLDVRLIADVPSARISAHADRPRMALVDASLHGSWELVEDLILDGVKVIVSSVRDEDVEEALRLGATSFMLRPLDRKLVFATLERCIETAPSATITGG